MLARNKIGKVFHQNKLCRHPTSAALYVYEYKMALFGNSKPE